MLASLIKPGIKPELNKISEYPAQIWALSWALLPFLILTLYSCYGGNLFFPRYFFFIQPYLITVLAAGFCALWRRQRFVALALGCGYLFLCISNFKNLAWIGAHSTESHDLIQEISGREQKDDVIILLANEPAHFEGLLKYFYHGGLAFYAPEELGRADDSWHLDPEKLSVVFSKLTAGKKRIWLIVRPAGLNSEDTQSLENFLRQNFLIREKKPYLLMNVLLLERKNL
jgi:hypothetical protein